MTPHLVPVHLWPGVLDLVAEVVPAAVLVLAVRAPAAAATIREGQEILSISTTLTQGPRLVVGLRSCRLLEPRSPLHVHLELLVQAVVTRAAS